MPDAPPSIALLIATVLVSGGASLLAYLKFRDTGRHIPWAWIAGVMFLAAALRIAGIFLMESTGEVGEIFFGNGMAALAAGVSLVLVLLENPAVGRNSPKVGGGNWEEKAVLLQKTLDSMSEGISFVDSDLDLLVQNRRFLDLLEFPPERFPGGHKFEEFIRFNAERGEYGPGDVDRLVRERVDLARKFKPHHFERTRPDGTVLDIRGNPLPGGGFVTTYADVTEHHQAEKALRESEEKFRQLVESTHAIVWEVDISSARFTYVGPQATQITGYPPEEWTDMDFWAAMIHPADRERSISFCDASTAKGEDHQFEYRLLRKGGELIWVRDIVTVISEDGRPVALRGFILDITEQKRAEEEIIRQQELLQTVFDTIPHRLFIKDRQGRFLMVNHALAAENNARPEDFIGKTLFELPFYTEEERRIATGHDNQVMESGEPLGIDGHVVTDASGREVHSNSIRLPWRDEQGEIAGIVGLREDISEQVRAQRDMRASQRLLELVLNAVPNPIWVKDLEGRYLLVNESFADFLGSTREALIGTTLKDSPGVSPEEVKIHLGTDRQVIETKQPVIMPELKATRADGEITWRHVVKVAAYDGEDNLVGIVGTSTDITDRIRAEEELRASQGLLQTVFDALPHAIFLKDLQGRYQMVNLAKAAFHGYSVEEILGKTFRDMPHGFEEVIGTIHDMEQEILKTGTMQELPVLRLRRPNGEESIRHVIKIPVRGAKGGITGFLSISEDITEKEKLGEQLRQSQKMEAIGQLSGGVAHDFNNLLTVILGNLELLEAQIEKGSKLHKFAHRSIKAAERGATLTQRMLAFSRIQALNPTLTNLNEMVTGLSDLMQSSLGETISIQLNMAEKPIYSLVDRSQLENALINLAVNSRDAMPGGGRLTISTEPVRVSPDLAAAHNVKSGDFVALRVADEGSGMSPEALEKSIDPFFTTKEIGEGSGLGLSMVYGFVVQSGGILQMESQPGKGTEVTILLPRDENEAHPVQDETKVAWLQKGKAETILVVEDNPDVRRMAAELLGNLGYEALEAEDADAALRILQGSARPALLFTDLVLPGRMNGRELADRARELQPGIPVLLTSGHAEEILSDYGALKNGMRLIPKPYRIADLAGTIRTMLSD